MDSYASHSLLLFLSTHRTSRAGTLSREGLTVTTLFQELACLRQRHLVLSRPGSVLQQALGPFRMRACTELQPNLPQPPSLMRSAGLQLTWKPL